MWPMIEETEDASIDLHCKVGERYPSHRAHSATAQERTRSENEAHRTFYAEHRARRIQYVGNSFAVVPAGG